MNKHRFIIALVLLLVTAAPVSADNNAVIVQNKFKQFFSSTALKVKEAATPQEKRDILNSAFEKMDNALSKIGSRPDIPEKDKTSILSIQNGVKEKYYELNGLKGYQRIADSQLDKFAEYVQQDSEQADQWVTISVTTLLLVVILLLLLVK